MAGGPGAGKTSLCYRLAWLLLERLEEGDVFSTPVIVDGRQLTSHANILKAVRESLEHFYRFSADENLVQEFILQRRLVVFLDGLSETPDFTNYRALAVYHNLPGIDRGAGRYVLTFRPDVLPEEDYMEFRTEAVNQPSQNPFLVLAIQPLDKTEDYLQSNDALGPWLFSKLAADRVLSQPLQNLCKIPLFLRQLTSAKGKETLTELLRITRGGGDRSIILHSMMKDVASRWIDQLVEGINEPNQTDLNLRNDLYQLCIFACGIYFQHRPNGDDSDEILPVSITISELIDLITREGVGQKKDVAPEERRVYLNRLLKVCSFVQRRQDGTCTLNLPDSILRDFFLSEYLTAALLDRGSSDRGQSLELWRRISRSPLTKQHRLVPLFFSGSWQRDQQREDITRILDRIRTDRELFNFASTSEGRYLAQNLVLIVVAARAAMDGSGLIDLTGLSLAGCDFGALEGLIGDDQPIRLQIRLNSTNCEFVRWGPLEGLIQRGFRDCLERGQWREEVRAVTKDTESKVAEFTRDVIGTVDFSEWALVPGNVFTVARYAGDDDLGFSKPVGVCKVWVGSFLIQHHPVTNGDFLKFVIDNRNEEWWPENRRTQSRNDYYLRGWDPILQDRDLKPGVRTWREVLERKRDDKDFKSWSQAPVVYVSWGAAKAYAQFMGWDLPTEAEFEVAARYFQAPEEGQEDLLDRDFNQDQPRELDLHHSDYPWGQEVLRNTEPSSCLKGYALYASRGNDQRRLIPTNNLADETVSEVELWKAWADCKSSGRPKGVRPVPHLVGSLRHWMIDVWRPQWPPDKDLKKSLDGSTVIFDPRRDDWDETEVTSDPERGKWQGFRTLRGGSLHLPAEDCRISYRRAQRKDNINPDVGFRCVRRLSPQGAKPQKA